MGYMKAEKRELFEKGTEKTGPFFYCRATDEEGHPLTLDISAAQGALFIGWGGGRSVPYRTLNWMARVTSCRLVGKQTITDETGVEPTSDTVHYLLFRLEDISPFAPRDISELVKVRNGVGKGGPYRTFQAKFKEVFVLPPPTVEVG